MLSRVAYIELCVPDIEASLKHATDLVGMRYVEERESRHYLTCSRRHHELVLRASDSPALGCIGLEARSPEAMQELCRRLRAEGVDTPPGSGVGVDRSVRFLAPGAIAFELFVAMEEDQAHPYDSVAVSPCKFGHATVKSSQPEKLESFLCDILDFRLSDRVPGVLSWFRCNADHHGLAIVPSQRDGLHHYGFEMEGWSSIESFSDHLCLHEVELIWGPGRHGPGRNIFTYHLDPAGAMLEAFTELQRVESEFTYRPMEWENMPRTLNKWGPPPPPNFLDYLVPCADPVIAIA